MGTDYLVLYLEMGSFTVCFAGYRFERTVPLFEESVAMLLEPLGRVRVVQVIVNGKEEKR